MNKRTLLFSVPCAPRPNSDILRGSRYGEHVIEFWGNAADCSTVTFEEGRFNMSLHPELAQVPNQECGLEHIPHIYSQMPVDRFYTQKESRLSF